MKSLELVLINVIFQFQDLIEIIPDAKAALFNNLNWLIPIVSLFVKLVLIDLFLQTIRNHSVNLVIKIVLLVKDLLVMIVLSVNLVTFKFQLSLVNLVTLLVILVQMEDTQIVLPVQEIEVII